MTYCLGIKVKSGIIGIADTRITSGSETTKAKKVYTVNKDKHSLFILTSGLRSVRDKAITYFKEIIEDENQTYNKLYKAVNAFASQVKKAAAEDKDSLKEAGLNFNLHALIGGQLEDDDEHKIYLMYPEGNWIEITDGSPFMIIGTNGYGKPILDRVLRYDSTLKFALKAGFLSFNATRVSANDVEFPIDVIYYEKDSFKIIEQRYKKAELQQVSKIWQNRLSETVKQLPDEWMDKLFSEVPPDTVFQSEDFENE